MAKIKLLLFLTFIAQLQINALDLPLISDIQDIIAISNDIQDIVNGNVPFKQLLTDGQVQSSNPLVFAVQLLENLEVQIGELESVFREKVDTLLETILERIPLEGRVDRGIEELHAYLSRAEYIYRTFEYYTKTTENFNNFTMGNLINAVTTTKFGGVEDILNKISSLFVPDKSANVRDGLMQLLIQRENLYRTDELCDRKTSLQRQLYEIYSYIVMAEMRAYTMNIFIYKLVNTYENGTVDHEIAKTRAQFVMRVEDYLLELHKHLGGASRTVFRCDPPMHIEGKTYATFNGLFQMMIFTEWQLFQRTCYYTCDQAWEYNLPFIAIPSKSSSKWWGPSKMCKGLITGCSWAGKLMKFCESPEESWKRFEWVSLEAFSSGERSTCNGTYWEVESYTTGGGLYNCHNCVCDCSEESADSTVNRTISLRPQISNIDENMVITNVKFTLKDKVIHIQIEESRVTIGGQVDRDTAHWVELEDFEYRSDIEGGGFYLLKDDEKIPLKRSVDFSFIRYGHNAKYLNIDDVIGPFGYILTGIRFNHERHSNDDEDNGSHLQLEIYVTPYEVITGKLVPTDENPSYWITPKDQPHPAPEYSSERTTVTKGGNVVYWPAPNIPDVTPNRMIMFDTSYWRNDAGQRTVPYFDIRPAAVAGLALDGVGFSYRSYEDHIGFIALKVSTLNMAEFIEPTMTKSQYKHYKRLNRKPMQNSPPLTDKLSPNTIRRAGKLY